MDEENRYSGGCACESVRYTMLGAPLVVHCCHCTRCQRETGSAFVLNAFIESDRLRLDSGEVEKNRIPSASGKGQDLVRCTKCKVVLWSHYGGLREKIAMLRVGTLDKPADLPPDIHIYTASMQPWIMLPESIPAMTEFYRYKDHWRADSLERLRVLLASK